VGHSHLVVLSDFDDILLTSALGIRKRFQSTPNALETCYFANQNLVAAFLRDEGEPRLAFSSLQVLAAER
jgi:hypothetical protein